MTRKSLAGSCCGLVVGLPWLLCVSIAGCASQGGAPTTPPELLGAPVADMADGGASSDLKPSKPLLWVKQLPASDNVDMVRQIAVDKSGNVFVACMFSGPTDFGDGPRNSQGNHDVALVKLTAAGDLVWVRQFGTSQEEWALRLVTDTSGNVIIAGSFSEPLNFGAGPVTSHGRDDYFLAKFSGAGGLMWAKALGSVEIERNNAELAVDLDGNIYFAGQFNLSAMSGSIDLGGGPLTSAGYADGFVAKFDPGGAHVFSKRLGGPYFDYVMSLALDKSGDILIGGQLTGPVDLGGGKMGPGDAGTPWAFVERLDKSGSYKWAVGFYSTGTPRVTALAIDDNGAIVVGGDYTYTLQTKTISLADPTGRLHNYLLQLDASGAEKWARGLVSGSVTDFSYGFLIDGSRILVGGYFEGSGDFGLGPRKSAGSSDGYLGAYSLAGMPQWVRQVGGDGDDWISAIARSADAIYAGGVFSKTVDFGGEVLTSKGFIDGFVMKLPLTPPVTPP